MPSSYETISACQIKFHKRLRRRPVRIILRKPHGVDSNIHASPDPTQKSRTGIPATPVETGRGCPGGPPTFRYGGKERGQVQGLIITLWEPIGKKEGMQEVIIDD